MSAGKIDEGVAALIASVRGDLADLAVAANELVEQNERGRELLERVNQKRAEIVEQLVAAGGNHLGDCIGCAAPLFEGDKGFCYSEGELSCESCASTYEELRAEAREILAHKFSEETDRESAERMLARCNEHLAAGGSLSDKWVWEL